MIYISFPEIYNGPSVTDTAVRSSVFSRYDDMKCRGRELEYWIGCSKSGLLLHTLFLDSLFSSSHTTSRETIQQSSRGRGREYRVPNFIQSKAVVYIPHPSALAKGTKALRNASAAPMPHILANRTPQRFRSHLSFSNHTTVFSPTGGEGNFTTAQH